MSMNILVLNSGSSSIKYQLFDMDDRAVLAGGLVERIGEPEGRHVHRRRGAAERERSGPVADHDEGFRGIIDALEETGDGTALAAVGHRVVHGGPAFSAATLLDDGVIARISEQTPLAPLHNPANLRGIEVAYALRPDLPQVAVFDTAFHASMPARAARYAIPSDVADAHGIRRYGFHGTSHAYVARKAAEYLGTPADACDLITLHLGNGASATAVSGGVSVDTSMGLSPLPGLVMGTRSGDVDPAVVFHLIRVAGMSADEVEHLLNRGSGLKGMCGENDMRAVEQRAAAGDGAAEAAMETYCYRVRHYIGAYLAVLGGADAIVFTGGIGENSATVRDRVCAGLQPLGMILDAAANEAGTDGRIRDVSASDSAVKVLVVPTDEELEIAEQTLARVGTP